MGIRIGQGYDAHRLVDGKPLILCGELVPFGKGLEGHSDADAACHAAIDAYLGAAAMGDVGHMFPETDEFRGANSLALLKRAAEAVHKNGYKLVNIDITIIAQQPRLSTLILAMRQNIAQALQTQIENVSVKATTEEGLGFTGEGDGISAHAVCLLEK